MLGGSKDLQHAFRMFRKSPGFVVIVVASMALGIAANTLMFSVLAAMLFKPLPFLPDADRLVTLVQRDRRGPTNVSVPTFRDWKAQQTVFEKMAAYTDQEFTLAGEGEPQVVRGIRTSEELFPLLRVSPFLGRSFLSEEYVPGKDRVLIASYAFWSAHLGADRQASGRKVNLDGAPRLLVGVMPRGFRFPGNADIWVPLAPESAEMDRGNNFLSVIARLKAGRTIDQSRTEMKLIAASVARQYSGSNADEDCAVSSLREELVGGKKRTSMLLLSCSVGFVLLIACINVASLQFTRNGARRKEIATRSALGATRSRLLGQFLAESVLLAAFGGIAGLLLAFAGLPLLRFLPLQVPDWLDIRIDGSALLFTAAVSVIAGLGFGIAPALEGSRLNLAEALRESGGGVAGGRRIRRLCSVCAIIEAALAFVLLSGAATAIHSLLLLQRVEPGFDVDNRVFFKFSLPKIRYVKWRDRNRAHQDLLARIRALPGIDNAAMVWPLPITADTVMQGVLPKGVPGVTRKDRRRAMYFVCSQGYFETLRLPLLAGRFFNPGDASAQSTAIMVSKDLARRFWKTPEDAVGNLVETGGEVYTIVGVTGDIRHFGLAHQVFPAVYVPYVHDPPTEAQIVIQSKLDPGGLTQAIKSAAWSTDQEAAITEIRPLQTLLDESTSPTRVIGGLLTAFSGCSLALAFMGLYGVVSYSMNQRIREIAVRRAVGATGHDMMLLILRQGLLLGASGVVIGVGLSLALSRLLIGLLYGITGPSATILAAISIGVVVTAGIAAYVPGAKAIQVDPVSILRHE